MRALARGILAGMPRYPTLYHFAEQNYGRTPRPFGSCLRGTHEGEFSKGNCHRGIPENAAAIVVYGLGHWPLALLPIFGRRNDGWLRLDRN